MTKMFLRSVSKSMTTKGLLSLVLKQTQKRSCVTWSLLSHLQAKIKFNGPITVAEYMKEALTNPKSGYYINRDVFGARGDFTTSPEISQMFGELIAIWFVNEWMMAGSPAKVQMVELGPGRGTMADDMLRNGWLLNHCWLSVKGMTPNFVVFVFTKFPELNEALSLHLVEVSEKLSEMQETKLSGKPAGAAADQNSNAGTEPHYRECKSKHGPTVYWYRDLKDVPRGYSGFVAHEFFDALPIHKFQRTEKGWREVLVDIDPEVENKLRFVVSPTDTPASVAYLQHVDSSESRDHLEVSPGSAVVVKMLSTRIAEDGGVALIADYGHDGEKGDTFRGFKQHQLHDVLTDPGAADLTADVDFNYFRKMAGNTVAVYGPITQRDFLHNMGIGVRLKILYEKTSAAKDKTDLLSGYHMLTDTDKMGERFKFFALLNKSRKDKPAAFTDLK